jgi:hypothetical protein
LARIDDFIFQFAPKSTNFSRSIPNRLKPASTQTKAGQSQNFRPRKSANRLKPALIPALAGLPSSKGQHLCRCSSPPSPLQLGSISAHAPTTRPRRSSRGPAPCSARPRCPSRLALTPLLRPTAQLAAPSPAYKQRARTKLTPARLHPTARSLRPSALPPPALLSPVPSTSTGPTRSPDSAGRKPPSRQLCTRPGPPPPRHFARTPALSPASLLAARQRATTRSAKRAPALLRQARHQSTATAARVQLGRRQPPLKCSSAWPRSALHLQARNAGLHSPLRISWPPQLAPAHTTATYHSCFSRLLTSPAHQPHQVCSRPATKRTTKAGNSRSNTG